MIRRSINMEFSRAKASLFQAFNSNNYYKRHFK